MPINFLRTGRVTLSTLGHRALKDALRRKPHATLCQLLKRAVATTVAFRPLTPASRFSILGFEQMEPRYLLAGDSSLFVTDPVYSLHGLNFSPYIAVGEDPDKGDGQITNAELLSRMQVVSQGTHWFRSFGCNEDLKEVGEYAHSLGKKAAIGAWIGKDAATNEAQIACLIDQARQGYVDIAIVGSETLLRGDVTETQLLGNINQVKSQFAAEGLSIPVTTADVYGVLLEHPAILAAVDVVFANYYPFWEGWPVDTAMAILHRQHARLVDAAGDTPVIVSETGWPSAGEQLRDAVPSPAAAASYLVNFVSWARANSVEYFYFEGYDEPWKVKHEGERGANWGIITVSGDLKEGMQPVFDGQTIPDNWTNVPGPPIIDFFNSTERVDTNLAHYVVAGQTPHSDDVVKLNGVGLEPGTQYANGVFTLAVALESGANTLELVVESSTGEILRSVVKTIHYDPSFSTGASRLLYVDAVVGESASALHLDGTIVISLDQNAVLGFIPGKHVRGLSPGGAEIYLSDRTVLSTASYRQLRVLPFTQTISTNAFLVDPQGNRLYSNREVVDVASNTLEAVSLPADIATGNSWASASIPGGPGITPDGGAIFARNTVVEIDTIDGSLTQTPITGTYTSDVALSPDGKYILVSRYGILNIYDANSYELVASVATADFGGEIRFLDDGAFAVVGSSGNPQNLGGGVFLVDMNTLSKVDFFASPLADNLETSFDHGEVFVSAGDAGWLAGPRFGVDVFVLDDDQDLLLTKTYFVGINEFYRDSGRPKNDQIRQLVYKSSPQLTVAVATDSGLDPTDGVTNDQSLTFSGVAPFYCKIEITANGELIGASRADSAGVWSVEAASPLPEGSYTVVATAREAAGTEIVYSGEMHVRIDVTAPIVTVAPQITNDSTPLLTGTVSEGALQVSLDGETYMVGDGHLVVANGSWTLQILDDRILADGPYNVQVIATDIAGNSGTDDTVAEITIDTQPPQNPNIESISEDNGRFSNDGITDDANLVIFGTGEPGSTLTLSRLATDESAETPVDHNGDWVFDYTQTTLPVGLHEFTASATDRAGNSSGESQVFSVLVYDSATNPHSPCDVTADGLITAEDVIAIINHLNGVALPPASQSVTIPPPPFLDPSGDGLTTPLDALLVINFINIDGAGPATSMQPLVHTAEAEPSWPREDPSSASNRPATTSPRSVESAMASHALTSRDRSHSLVPWAPASASRELFARWPDIPSAVDDDTLSILAADLL